ncbi:DNase I-like protein [Sarocladium strictum]
MVLTFNCAKNIIEVPVFADHMHDAFRDNATGLPDLIAISLQEVAPLSYSFIGGYFLEPYLSAFEDAINEAALRVDTAPIDNTRSVPKQGPKKPYTLVRSHNVGYTAILLLARDPDTIRKVQQAEVGFGAAEMGNKGAVGLRVLYDAGGEGRETELTFVATHLAAMEWNLPKRNANWAAVMRGLTFDDPEAVVERFRTDADGTSSGDQGDGERTRLLHDEHQEQHLRLRRHIHDISVFKPSSHLFVAGDLNYRISTTSPPANAAFPSLDPASENHYTNFIPLDQLTRERKAGRTMHGLQEAEVKFPPTYKYDIKEGSGNAKGADVEWSFAPHRWPSWTDRVLYLDVPAWASGKGSKDKAMEVQAYNAMPIVRFSDHRGVYLRVNVPLISPSELAPPLALEGSETAPNGLSADPRVRLPMEVDPEAWGRRAAARKKEVMAGWSMFLWSTWQGAVILGTVVVAGAGAYWWRTGF